MEELLNKLIEKGWKPFGWEVRETKKGSYNNLYYGFDNHPELYHIRMLVSIDSGLWQFVCENKLVKTKDKEVRYRYEDLERTQNYFSWYGYEYRIIESALLKENELEKFLLDNIKV